jgi:NAD(P)-dependent dehydrogenase (short-subunit alcohol dehydrogenase family)
VIPSSAHRIPELANKVAIVTGAGRQGGLGKAIASAFVASGTHVAICDLAAAQGDLLPGDKVANGAEAEVVAAELRELARSGGSGARVVFVPCDVRDEAQVAGAVAAVLEEFGRIDILVNNAGVGYIIRPLTELSVEEWDLVQEVNLRGAFLFTKHVGRHFMERSSSGSPSGGRIINIASKGAKSPSARFAAYAASKHGMVGLTRVAALEFASLGVTVNAVCPNHVTTGLGALQNESQADVQGKSIAELLQWRRSRIPLGRVGLPEDTANACLFLASDAAAYITGEAMNVSGGEEMR